LFHWNSRILTTMSLEIDWMRMVRSSIVSMRSRMSLVLVRRRAVSQRLVAIAATDWTVKTLVLLLFRLFTFGGGTHSNDGGIVVVREALVGVEQQQKQQQCSQRDVLIVGRCRARNSKIRGAETSITATDDGGHFSSSRVI